jgi:hypothetical protein
MNALQQALQNVGYKQVTQAKPTLANIVDTLLAPITRKIQVQKAGGFYRARYAGRPTSCFGLTAEQAIKYLKLLDVGAQ